MLNYLLLITFTITILLPDVPYLEICSQNAGACAKLKQLTKGMTKHGTYEGLWWNGGTFLHTAPFG